MSYGTASSCDECGKVGFLDRELIEDRRLLEGWLVVGRFQQEEGGGIKRWKDYHFCSLECVRAWTEAQDAGAK